MLKRPSESLTAKITLVGFLSILVFIGVLLTVSFYLVSDHMRRIYLEKGDTLAHSLDASIRTAADLDNEKMLFISIQKSIWLEPDLMSVTIFKPAQSKLISFLSSRPDLVGVAADPANLEAFRSDMIVTKELDLDSGLVLRVFAPIHVARKQIGTFQFDLTLEYLSRIKMELFRSMLLGYIPIILITMLILLFFVRVGIILPVLEIGKGARKLTGGNFDARVPVRSSDELGVLSQDFNRMASSLEQQREIIIDSRQHMEHQALHDDLTSLPNRAYLQKQIPVYISACRRHGRRGAVILLDLDGFKLVNDSLGHEAGDELLKCIGQRLVNDIRKEDFVARLGGDEFVVVLSDISDDADTAIEQINQVLESLLENIAKPVKLEDTDVRVTSSIGVVFFPDRYDNYETIMKNVDSAMYKAKELGGNRGNLFDLEMQQLMVIKTQVLRGIKDAIHSDQLRVYYQPQVNDKGEFIGAEALVRWMHPQQGLLPPQKFIHVIENNSLVIDLSHWVLKTVCLQYRHLCECYGSSDNFSVSLNVSSNQFHQVSFVEQIIETLDRYDFPHRCLVLEVTERALLRDTQETRNKIESLKSYGVRISIDDFGTGYSSLAYLKNLSFDEIKLDASFIHDLFNSTRDQELVCTIISMSRSLNVNMVAEGVETSAQFEFLKAQNCPVYQGYYFQKPMSQPQFESYLQQA